MKIMRTIHLLILIILAAFTSSCANYNLMQETNRDEMKSADEILTAQVAQAELAMAEGSLQNANKDYILKANDKISISIWDHDELSIGSVYGKYNANEVYGRWLMIAEDGTVPLAKLGPVQLEGKTINEAEVFLIESYSKWIKNPVISVRVLNREVSVIGEVINSGNFTLESSDHMLMEIIAKAGGFTDYADTKNLTFIRDGQFYHFDLTQDGDRLLSQLTIENGDMIYVPAQKGKNVVKKSPAVIAITGVISTIALIISVAK